MSRLKHFLASIKGRLILGVILLHAVLMGIFVYDLTHREGRFLHEQSLSEARGLSGLIASNASLPLLNNDIVALMELVDQVKHLPDMKMIYITDNNYRIRASNEPEYFNKTFTDASSLTIQREARASTAPIVQTLHDGILDTSAPIRIRDKTIGYVRIISSTETISTQMDTLLHKGLMYIYIAVFGGGIIAWLIVRNLTYHLTLLSNAASEITQRNYEITLPEFKGDDEISRMGQAFRAMIDSIHDQVNSLSLEIDKRKTIEQILDYKAHHDELTHLCNRSLFMDRLEHAMKKAKRQNTQLAVLFIDLDRFKEINDSFGHEIGDDVLIAIADKLSDNLREIDTIARLGGDEFTLIIEDVEDVKKVDEIVIKLMSVLKQPLYIHKHELTVTSSIGISFYPLDAENAQTLLRNADLAMYKAKEEGQNCYRYYSKNDVSSRSGIIRA